MRDSEYNDGQEFHRKEDQTAIDSYALIPKFSGEIGSLFIAAQIQKAKKGMAKIEAIATKSEEISRLARFVKKTYFGRL